MEICRERGHLALPEHGRLEEGAGVCREDRREGRGGEYRGFGAAHLVRLAEEINHPLFGLCFDIGHRELFSKLTPVEWLEPMAPWLFELHLHDNLGIEDDHLPIGGGKIEFGEFFERLRELGLNPVYTLEAHSEKDALASLANLRKFIPLIGAPEKRLRGMTIFIDDPRYPAGHQSAHIRTSEGPPRYYRRRPPRSRP